MGFIDTHNLRVRGALASSTSDPEIPRMLLELTLLTSGLCFHLQSLLSQTQRQQGCLWLQVHFFFFPLNHIRGKKMFLFLTECSNRSPGVGIPGWHGVLELTTQLAKSLSPELLLQPMVHIYICINIQFVLFLFFSFTKTRGRTWDTGENKTGQMPLLWETSLSKPCSEAYLHQSHLFCAKGKVINRPFKGPR